MSDKMLELDPVIHPQARLRVTASLYALNADDLITFPRLQELLGVTPGNLSTHLRKLEDAGYVEITKTHRQRVPTTLIGLTPVGRSAFERYIDTLRTLLQQSPGSIPGAGEIG